MSLRHFFQLTFLIFCSACASVKTANNTRSLASIDSFPQVSASGYFVGTSLADLLEKRNQQFKYAAQKTKASTFTFDEQVDFYDLLNKRLLIAVQRTQKILGNPDIPAPRLIIAKDPKANAYVAPMDDCVTTSLTFWGEYGKGKKLISQNALKVSPYALTFRGMSQSSDDHVYANLASPTEDVIVGSDTLECFPVQNINGENLKLDLSRRTINYGGLCTPRMGNEEGQFDCKDLDKNYLFKQISTSKTLPFIFITAGLLAALNSYEELDAVFAHELGHYYLGHAYTPTVPRSYFYNRMNQTRAFRPPEDQALKVTGDGLLAVGNLKAGRSVPGIFEESISGEILLSALRNFEFQDSGRRWTYDPSKCAKYLKGEDNRKYVNLLYSDQISGDDEKKLNDFFTRVKECTQSVVAGPGKDENYLRYFTQRPPKLMLMDFLLKEFKSSRSANAWEAFTKIEPVMTKRIRDLHSGEELKQIGYYTFEEEADAFAINYLLSNGQPVRLLQSALAAMLQSEITADKRKFIEEQNCLNAYGNNWTLNGQQYIPVPTNYSDLHHGFCFRLYNVDQISRRLGQYDATQAENYQGKVSFAVIRETYRRISASNR